MPPGLRSLAVSMLSMDEPDHTRLRSIVEEAFRRRAIIEMEPRIFGIADELAAELFADRSPADLVERYARRLPLAVICELLGLPPGDRPRFIAWAKSLTRPFRHGQLSADAGRNGPDETVLGRALAGCSRQWRRRFDCGIGLRREGRRTDQQSGDGRHDLFAARCRS